MKIIRKRRDKNKSCFLNSCEHCGAMLVLEYDEVPWSGTEIAVRDCPECYHSLSDNYDFDYYPCDEDGNV